MINIFIDFDGTITRNDVGDKMFETFGGTRCLKFVEEYRDEKISAIECFRKECTACGVVEKDKLDAFLDNQEIDSTFGTLLRFCADQGIRSYILSDGMDYYVQRILNRNGLTGIPYYTNHLKLIPLDGNGNVALLPSFPYTDEVCNRCACCKRNHILTLSADDDINVYIGEGYSDRCPARYADIVFAKDELLKYCREENISYLEYRTFDDIVNRLTSLLVENNRNISLRKRRHAQLACREAFLGG